MSEAVFLAGAAREDITPAVGTLLYGYNPHQESTSVHDPLCVTAAAFRQGEETALLLSVTVGDFQTQLCDEIRTKIAEACAVPVSRILVSATHTHSAPNVAGMEGWGGVDRPYVDGILFPAMLRASEKALLSMTAAEISVGVTRSEVGVNRRQLTKDGRILLGQNPWGLFDPAMTVIAVRDAETKTGILNLIHYGCHGTAAGCNHEITRDWSGVMTDRVEAETGTLTAFWNGAIGDVGPRLTNGKTVGDIRHVEELGGVAAMDAMRAYRARGSYAPGRLTVREGEVRIPYRPLMEREAAEEKLASYEHPEKLENIQKLEYAYYKETVQVYTDGIPPHDPFYRIPQTVVSLGDVVFIPTPFEIFSEISLRLREHSGVIHTLALSNTNGYREYLPTEDQLCRGGYEVQCFRFGGAYSLADNADQVLIEESLRILEGK